MELTTFKIGVQFKIGRSTNFLRSSRTKKYFLRSSSTKKYVLFEVIMHRHRVWSWEPALVSDRAVFFCPDVDGLSSVRWAVLYGMGLGTALSADGASVHVQDGASDGTLAVLQLVESVHSLTLRCS